MSSASRFAVFLCAAVGVWLLLHLYAGWRLWGLPLVSSPGGRRWLLVVMAAGFLCYPAGRIVWHHGWHGPGIGLEYVGAVWMGFVFLLFVFLAATDVATLGGFVLRPWLNSIRTGAAALAVVGAVAGVIGGLQRPRVVEVELEAPSLAAEHDGLTLVQLSDVHLGTLIGERFLGRLIARVEALKPDVVVITGDLVDADWNAVDGTLPLLKRLRAPRGVLAVTGNHEYYAGIDRCHRLLSETGFTCLENRHVEVVPGLVIAGVPDARGAAQMGEPGPDLAAALDGVDDSATVVLLQHAPERETEAAAAGVDLLLNGHTHGAQLWPFHYLVRLAYPHLAGVFKVGDMTQVVSRGAGRWGPPMRLLAPPDIVRVTVTRAEPRSRHDSPLLTSP